MAARNHRLHERIKLLSVEERLDAAADILVIGLLRLLAKDEKLREIAPGTDEYEQVPPDACPRT